MKKNIVFLLIMCMVLSTNVFFPVTASAIKKGTCGDDIVWTLDEEGTLTISGTGTMDKNEISWRSVWYPYQEEIRNVHFEGDVQNIPSCAFKDCKNLTEIRLPYSIKIIGGMAFDGCCNLKDIYFFHGIKSVGDINESFKSCSPEITIHCPYYAFGKPYAHNYHINYKAMPATTIVLEGSCGEDIKWTVNVGGELNIMGTGEMYNYSYTNPPPWKELYKIINTAKINTGVTNIGSYAFWGCENLKTIGIPSTVTTIGDCAFDGCVKLWTIDILDDVKQVGGDIFANCNPAPTIYGNSGSYISSYAEANNIPFISKQTVVIGSGACGDNLYWTLDAEGKLSISGSGAMFNFQDGKIPPWKNYIDEIKEISIGNQVETIGNYAFVGLKIKKLVIPDSVQSIGEYAFECCSELTTIIVGDGVKTIKAGAFDHSFIEDLYLGKNVTEIESRAFGKYTTVLYTINGKTHVIDRRLRNLIYSGTEQQLQEVISKYEGDLIGEKTRIYYNFDDRYKTDIPESCNINIGDYVELGSMYGKPIVWSVLNIIGNKVFLFSKDPVMLNKSFDYCGENESYHSLGERNKYGSNNWEHSNIRQWLNSTESEVSWTHCPPEHGNSGGSDGIWRTVGYDKEPGFLSDENFLTQEKNCIVDTNNYFVKTHDGDYVTTDKVFLLSGFETSFFVDDIPSLKLPEDRSFGAYEEYWLREYEPPNYYYYDGFEEDMYEGKESTLSFASYSKVSGSGGVYPIPEALGYFPPNIRPAMVIDLSLISFNHGKGTAIEPYKCTQVCLNGEKMSFERSPVIADGRTLVPMREIFEKLGADIDWDGDTQTVTSTKDGIRISMTIGSNKMYKNSQEITLDVAPQIVNSRTLVPVRAIAESFNCNVDWDAETYTVSITE